MICKWKAQPCGWASLFRSLVFSSGGETSPDVSLLFVYIKDLPDLKVERSVVLRKTLLKILMYRGLGDPEMLGGGADCGAGFDHVHSQAAGALFDGICHNIPSDCCVLPGKAYAGK
jgi:hypothetical protein